MSLCCTAPVIVFIAKSAIFNYTPCMFRIISILFFIFVFAQFAFADLKVTSVSQNGGKYAVVFNNSIKISNLSLNQNIAARVEFPSYKGKNKQYKQFSLLKRDYASYLAGVLKSRSADGSADLKTDFKINKFDALKKKSSIKAFASIIFEDTVEVECRVMDSGRGLWIAWPSRKEAGKRVKEFEFTDKNLKIEVETALVRRYKENDTAKEK
ncbi:septation protein SpoVG family protein [Endomicrobium proavitum]|uniref:Uncharacterized protein n=1 Tax=Endomicrobium proavitum TaxID=1408281 RepID=A0A0G3WJ89_9BACT|nr:septation protein SpoVG family protein [Endomicrobium proavitum]AKL97529.1 hypothetical protein Epro_0150 [Endomicrobium proavitum]